MGSNFLNSMFTLLEYDFCICFELLPHYRKSFPTNLALVFLVGKATDVSNMMSCTFYLREFTVTLRAPGVFSVNNKKVLLRERKRHVRCADLSWPGGTYSGRGVPTLAWWGGAHTLVRT